MTRKQITALLTLSMAVLALFGTFFVFVVRDIMSQDVAALSQGVQAAPPPPPLVPSPTPTAPAYSAEHAISFVKGYKLVDAQERNLAGLISTVEEASRQLGHEVKVEGWWAENQTGNEWIVGYGYQENDKHITYRFLVNLEIEEIQGYNEAAVMFLMFLRQQAAAGQPQPTPTIVRVTPGWGARDYYTNWQYSVTGPARVVKDIRYQGKQQHNKSGFVVIPLKLENLAASGATLNPGFYARFSLRDAKGELSGVVSDSGLLQPTALYCASAGLPHFTRSSVHVGNNEGLDTALVFRLQSGTIPPYTLQVTVYEGSVPHRYHLSVMQ